MKCYEKFMTPEISKLYDDDLPDNVTKADFICREVKKMFSIFIPDGGTEDVKYIADIAKTALSVCHQCPQFQQTSDNAGNSN